MFSTKDISLAAYIRYRGHNLKTYYRGYKGGEWVFDLTIEESIELKKDYVNSEFSKFEGIRRGMAKQKYE